MRGGGVRGGVAGVAWVVLAGQCGWWGGGAGARGAGGGLCETAAGAGVYAGSVPVDVYVPAARPLNVPVPVYGAVPPVAVIVALPVELPKHNTSTCVSAATRAALG